MKQILVAAWVGIIAGWMGFGWVLAEAPEGKAAQMAAMPAVEMEMARGVDILPEPVVSVRGAEAMEPNLRG